MLWLKAWLEIRWRILFVTGFVAFPLILHLLNPPSQATPGGRQVFLGVYATFLAIVPLSLAGCGVKTQSGSPQPIRGGHKSTYFTLSLPVTRFRLFAVRAGLGMLAVIVVVLVACGLLWATVPELQLTWVIALEYVLAVCVCDCALYSLSLVLATFLDQVFQLWACMLIVMAGGFYSLRTSLPAFIDIFRAMGSASPIVTHTLPWAAMAVSLVISPILFLAALKIVQTREY